MDSDVNDDNNHSLQFFLYHCEDSAYTGLVHWLALYLTITVVK